MAETPAGGMCGGAPQVYWSDRLEELADGLFRQWEESAPCDPFARTCVVADDSAARAWLQRRFLECRAPGRRRVLANIDFKPLAEFANDWLAAQTHGACGARRSAAAHPYARGVLAWRVFDILRRENDNPALAIPQAYIASGGSAAEDRRRYGLSVRVAALFSDYLEKRFRMLSAWEAGENPPGEDRWQAVLYRMLAAEAPETYTRDYARALAGDADPQDAFRGGFPRYAAIHVFDIPFAPWPYLAMLRKIAAATPVCFWTFNPSSAYWLDDPGKKQAMREAARRAREALMRGDPPEIPAPENMFDTPEARLLGALATGARGTLSAQLDLSEGDCRWLGREDAPAFSALALSAAEVHVCHSPRRELEAARDALHRFFEENHGAKPSDALVLCADWEAYSPLAGAVFGAEGENAIPVSFARAPGGEAPAAHSFAALLGFRSNRFGVNDVFGLLGTPAVRKRAGIDADGLAVLRRMVRENNIHWGYDDADVDAAMGADPAAEHGPYPFTWRRGLDRFAADALLGPRANPEALFDAGRIGRLLPRGCVEGDRARLAGALDAFVEELAALRAFMRRPHSAAEWRDRLLRAIDCFYDQGEEYEKDVRALRAAVASACDDAATALAGAIPSDAMCAAVQAALKPSARLPYAPCDSVLFAPLSCGAATPARFTWICGLNDGGFPRADDTPAFDLAARRPALFDASRREKDSYALLKAALCARGRLSFSYTGRNARTNEEIPPAVPLADLLEWYKARGLPVATYRHPLQAFSARYFTAAADQADALPPSYSAADRAAAAALAERTRGAAASGCIVPFTLADEGCTEIAADDLADFCANPHRFLARSKLGIALSKPEYDILSDNDNLIPGVPVDLCAEILVRGMSAADFAVRAEPLAEEGFTPDAAALSRIFAQLQADGEAYRRRPLKFQKSKDCGFTCTDMTAAQALAAWQDGAQPAGYTAAVDVRGRRVSVSGTRMEIELETTGGRRRHVFCFSKTEKVPDSVKIGAWVRHVAGHAAGGEGFVTVLMSMKNAAICTYRPLPREQAAQILAGIVVAAALPFPFDPSKAGGRASLRDLPEHLAAAVRGCVEMNVNTHGTK